MKISFLRAALGISMFGFLLPLGWPARRMTLTGLLVFTAGLVLGTRLCASAFRHGGWPACLFAFLAANLLISSIWITLVALITGTRSGSGR